MRYYTCAYLSKHSYLHRTFIKQISLFFKDNIINIDDSFYLMYLNNNFFSVWNNVTNNLFSGWLGRTIGDYGRFQRRTSRSVILWRWLWRPTASRTLHQNFRLVSFCKRRRYVLCLLLNSWIAYFEELCVIFIVGNVWVSIFTFIRFLNMFWS